MGFSYSALQLSGIVGGLMLLLLLAARLQRSPNNNMNSHFLLPTGFGLLMMSLYPDLASIPASIFDIPAFPGSRLITLSVVAVAIIWLILASQIGRSRRLAAEVDNLQIALARMNFVTHLGQIPAKLVLVVMPAFNEAKNIGPVLSALPESVADYSVRALVVDDCSDDRTVEVARSHGAWVVSLLSHQGGGTAVRTGYRIADDLNARYTVTMDADGQHLPGELNVLLQPLFEQRADFVIGSRRLGQNADYSKVRRVGVFLFSTVVSIMMRISITDCSSGYRAFNTRKLKALPLRAKQYHTAESIIAALKHGLRIVEVPITIAARRDGRSKKGAEWRYAFNFLSSVVGAWWR